MRWSPFLLVLVPGATALRLLPPMPTTSRRGAIGLALAVAATPSAAPAARPTLIPIKDDLKLLIVKAKALRGAVRSGAAARRNLPFDPTPGVNNYASLTAKVLRDKQSVLLPLQAELQAVAAASAANSLLPPELQKKLELQPVLMGSHFLELDQALEKFKFEAYTSKRSGRDYPGGKVERELEEISETCDDFLTLAAGIKLSAAAEED